MREEDDEEDDDDRDLQKIITIFNNMLVFLEDEWPDFDWSLKDFEKTSASNEKMRCRISFRASSSENLILTLQGPEREIVSRRHLVRWKAKGIHKIEGKKVIGDTELKVEGKERTNYQALKTVMKKLENEVKKMVSDSYEDIQDLYCIYQKIEGDNDSLLDRDEKKKHYILG